MSGYEPGIKAATASAVFKVRCKSTRPGEAVFVVGSHEALGAWSTAMALALTTTADTFPTWQSAPIPLLAGMMVEYKFIIQREDRQGTPQWQKFDGNYRVTPVAGQVLQAVSDWEVASAEISTLEVPEEPPVEPVPKPTKPTEADKAIAQQENEERLLKMAESGVEKAAAEVIETCPLAVTLTKREMSRRNFSQSLLTLDVDAPEPEKAENEKAEKAEETKKEQKLDKKEGEKTEGTPQSTTATEEVKEINECTAEDADAQAEQAEQAEAQDAPAEAPADVVVTQAPMDDEDEAVEYEVPLKGLGAPAVRGVPLKHITSFSALADVADAQTKVEHRRREKEKAQSRYQPYNLDVPVVIVTSEVAPYSKTGGLGMVAASYGFEFARNGHRTMVVAPKYKHYDGISYCGETRVRIKDQEENVKYWHLRKDCGEGKGTDFLFIEGRGIQRDGGLYNDDDGREYPDNLERFTMLCLAAMEAPLILDINGEGKYGDKVIFLANDWQAGLVPVYMCYKYRRHNCYTQARAIYVIHNLGYQGQYHGHDACRFFGIDSKAAHDLVLGNCINLSKGALICADRVLTVSPNYSKEIQTASGGFNLQDFVSAKAASLRLAGILNGIDDCWDPAVDPDVFVNFSVEDFEKGKMENKAALQKMLGLDVNPDLCLIGFVGRLTWQKGIDVLASVISWLMQDTGNGVTGQVQLIMMGNGERQYSDTLRWAESNYKGRVCGYVGFDPKVEHQMMAACDLLLMPSRYEPCGLPQMYSQMYGTLPVVHATGGLVDSVKDVSIGVETATGFLVSPLSSDKLKETLFRAVELNIKRKQDFLRMQRTAMQHDYYWPKAMDEYERQIDIVLYEPATVR